MDNRQGRTRESESYWTCARSPLASLVFITPLIVAYEAGLLLAGPEAMRNGADVWLRNWLAWSGFGEYFLLPVLTCLLLLAWHHLRGDAWRLHWSVLYGMALESFSFAILLVVLAYLEGRILAAAQGHMVAVALSTGSVGDLVAFLGAGIYEELLFRLMFLPFIALVARSIGTSSRTAWIMAACVTSLLFAAAHYGWEIQWGGRVWWVHEGEVFRWTTFSFRTVAGGVFAALFIYRGFGIAVGTQAMYDILVYFW